MELREVISQIVQKKFSAVPEKKRPQALAKALDISEMDARRLIIAGRNQSKQFGIFLNLLPLCRELNIDMTNATDEPTAAPLLTTRAKKVRAEVAEHVSGHHQNVGESDKRRKRRDKTELQRNKWGNKT